MTWKFDNFDLQNIEHGLLSNFQTGSKIIRLTKIV